MGTDPGPDPDPDPDQTQVAWNVELSTWSRPSVEADSCHSTARSPSSTRDHGNHQSFITLNQSRQYTGAELGEVGRRLGRSKGLPNASLSILLSSL